MKKKPLIPTYFEYDGVRLLKKMAISRKSNTNGINLCADIYGFTDFSITELEWYRPRKKYVFKPLTTAPKISKMRGIVGLKRNGKGIEKGLKRD